MRHACAEEPTRGYVCPSPPALIEVLPDAGLRYSDLAAGESFVARGVLATALLQMLTDGPATSLTQLLRHDPRMARAVGAVTAGGWLPLSPGSAVALDGFHTLFVELTGRCNERCLHCYAAGAGDAAPHLSWQTCAAVVADARELGFGHVQLTGGEPLLCPFLVELVAHCAQLGIARCEIFTNGVLLDEPLLTRLAPLRPAFALSVYSHDAATHDLMTQTPGSHSATRRALGLLCEAGLPVRAGMVVTQHNAGHEAATIDYLNGLGVRQVSVAGSKAVGRGQMYTGAVQYPAEQLQQPERKSRDGKLCVAYDGSVYPCIFNRAVRLGHLAERSLRAIATDPALPHLAAEEVDALCRERLQCGSCRLTLHALAACQQHRPPAAPSGPAAGKSPGGVGQWTC